MMIDELPDPTDEAEIGELIDDAVTEEDVKALSAFGYETRYRLVRLLVASEDGLGFDEIAPHVSVSDSAVSHALTLLSDAGLVRKEKRGRSRTYHASERAEALVGALDETR